MVECVTTLHDALDAWKAAAQEDRAAAYYAYVAALDLEEVAAAELARSCAVRTAA